MRFCQLFSLYNNPKPKPISSKMASSSSQQAQAFIEPQRTTLIPVEELDVQCEMFIDLENLRDNGFDLIPAVEFQGWN